MFRGKKLWMLLALLFGFVIYKLAGGSFSGAGNLIKNTVMPTKQGGK